MFSNIRADMKRYKEYGGWYKNPGFWVTFVYRYGSWASSIRPKIFSIPFRLLYVFFRFPFRLFYHVYIATSVKIGPGLLLEHPFMIMIVGDAIIGKECTIFHDVTFGKGPKKGDPQIGDHVVIFPGARVLGGIDVGENAHIGANVVLQKTIPPWTMVIPPQSKTIPEAMVKRLLGIKTEE